MSVRIIWAVALVVAIVVPAMAQDKGYPQIEAAGGYANWTLPTYESPGGRLANYSGKHSSGLSMDLNWNPLHWFGFDNYTGLHYLGTGSSLLANIPGGRIIGRKLFGSRVVPYGVAGFGFVLFSDGGGCVVCTRSPAYRWSKAARYGAGTDVQLMPGVGVRIETSRVALHVLDDWPTTWNISTGLVFRVR